MLLKSMSRGIWSKRDDLCLIIENQIGPANWTRFASRAHQFIGWGQKPSGLAAQKFAKYHGGQALLFEDGFLRSFAPGGREPSMSYVYDTQGIYYDSRQPSDLETLLNETVFSEKELARADLALNELCQRRLSKYNNAPFCSPQSLGIPSGKPYVLLIDQVAGDASIAGAGANQCSFETMFDDALAYHGDVNFVVRAHPASRVTGHLEAYARQKGGAIILKERANLWPILEEAAHVHVVSSHVGFEALMAGRPVTCHGMPYYKSWGLTVNEAAHPRRQRSLQLNEIFAGTYLRYTHYLDAHLRSISTLENAIDQLTLIRDSRLKNRAIGVTVGFSSWKRKAVKPFLISTSGSPKHARNLQNAIKAIGDGKADLIVWGQVPAPENLPDNVRIIRMEDGFLRSVGLGAAFRFPNSLVRETGPHLYFDARGKGTISELVAAAKNDRALIIRAQKLRTLILENHITKYMLAGVEGAQNTALPDAGSRLKILVTGQVESDASIRLGSPVITTNTQLLRQVRLLYPDAIIAYREHPDVSNGLRDGRADRSLSDINADTHDINHLFDWCDRVETMTSLSGFEALLRGKPVGVHGWPFYAGWGLTQDRMASPARGAASLDELVATSLILYPDYVHPRSRLPCTPEEIINALKNTAPATAKDLIVRKLGFAAGRMKTIGAKYWAKHQK